MPSLVSKLSDIQTRLDALAAQHRIPGAALGVMSGDTVLEFATGVVNRNTGVETTPDTLFQIGSNTKIYTTTLVMQLVDRGEVELDAPVRTYLPDFQLADEEAAEAITVRHLLTHSSGMQGDHFEDFGPGDDGLAQYVESLAKITQVHPVGDRFSYCNSGFCLAGRIVEVITSKPYHEALREMLLEPLGLRSTTVLFQQMLAHRYAVGHTPGPEPGRVQVPARVMMSRSQAPAGSITSATASDVLRFVRFHLDEGLAFDGSRILSADSIRAMQEPHVERPRSALGGGHVGLGWLLAKWGNERVFGHGGGTIGQLSYLQVLPDKRFAVCLLTNSAYGRDLWLDVGSWLFEEFASVTMPRSIEPADPPPDLDLARYTGTYERLNVRYDVTVEDGQLVVTVTNSGPLSDLQAPPHRLRLRPVDRELFWTRSPISDMNIEFTDFDKRGRPGYFGSGARVAPRVDTGDEPSPSSRAAGTRRTRSSSRTSHARPAGRKR